MTACSRRVMTVVAVGVPGVVAVGGYQGGAIPGTTQPVPDPGLFDELLVYSELNRFIRPFDCK